MESAIDGRSCDRSHKVGNGPTTPACLPRGVNGYVVNRQARGGGVGGRVARRHDGSPAEIAVGYFEIIRADAEGVRRAVRGFGGGGGNRLHGLRVRNSRRVLRRP
jgi:hypothetical protein